MAFFYFKHLKRGQPKNGGSKISNFSGVPKDQGDKIQIQFSAPAPIAQGFGPRLGMEQVCGQQDSYFRHHLKVSVTFDVVRPCLIPWRHDSL